VDIPKNISKNVWIFELMSQKMFGCLLDNICMFHFMSLQIVIKFSNNKKTMLAWNVTPF